MTDPFSPAELYGWVEHQAAMGPRRPGSPAGRANEDFLFQQLQAFGLADVRREPVPVTHHHTENTALTVGGDSLDVFGIPYAKFTPSEGVTAPLVYADPGLTRGSDAWRGRIVVTEIRFPMLDAPLLLRLAMSQPSEHAEGAHSAGAERKQVVLDLLSTRAPLPNGGARTDLVDEVRRAIRGASAGARRTDRAPLARKREQHPVPAAGTAHPRESVREDSAAQEPTPLILDEARQPKAMRALLSCVGEHALPPTCATSRTPPATPTTSCGSG